MATQSKLKFRLGIKRQIGFKCQYYDILYSGCVLSFTAKFLGLNLLLLQ